MPTVAAKKAPSAAKTAERRKSLASSPKRREPGCMGGYYGLRVRLDKTRGSLLVVDFSFAPPAGQPTRSGKSGKSPAIRQSRQNWQNR